MSDANADQVPDEQSLTKKRSVAFVGMVLMLASLPLWPALLLVPFLPISVEGRAIVATAMVVVAEIAFWFGAALAGPEAARKVRSFWRARRGGGVG